METIKLSDISINLHTLAFEAVYQMQDRDDIVASLGRALYEILSDDEMFEVISLMRRGFDNRI